MSSFTSTALCSLFCSVLFAAPGDILGVTVVNTGTPGPDAYNGSVVEILVEGLGTGGTYEFGYGTFNVPLTPRLTLTVLTPGYGTDGLAQTKTRTLYGTVQAIRPFPNSALADETVSGSNVIIRVYVHQLVYSTDSVSAVIVSGLYTQGGTPNAAFAGAVTNNSTAVPPKVVANWTTVWRRLVKGTLTLSAFGMSGTARNAMPLAAIEFRVTDGTTTLTQVVSGASMTKSTGMAVDFYHYVHTFDISGYADNATLTANFIAYPELGSTASAFDTNENAAFTEVRWLAKPVTFIVGDNASFGRLFAYVSTTGNDGTCVASPVQATARASACATLARACTVLFALSFSSFGRRNGSNHAVYFESGTYLAAGATFTGSNYSSTNDTVWFDVGASPDVDPTTVIFQQNATSTSRSLPGRYVHLHRVTFSRTSSTTLFSAVGTANTQTIWFDSATINESSTYSVSPWLNFGLVYGLKLNVLSGRSPASRILIGSTVRNADNLGQLGVMIGNDAASISATSGTTVITESSGCGDASSDGAIVYNNKFQNIRWTFATLNAVCTWTIGGVFAQNLIEVNIVSAGVVAWFMGGDGQVAPSQNIVSAHNTVIGQRFNSFYNDQGTVSVPRLNITNFGNSYEYNPIKTDTFSPGDGNRVGNWKPYNGVFVASNGSQRGDFRYRFIFNGYAGTDADPISPQFIDDKSGGANSGYGDYHLQATSPLIGLIRAGTQMLPYDLDGRPRKNDGTGAAGVYEYYPAVYPPVRSLQ